MVGELLADLWISFEVAIFKAVGKCGFFVVFVKSGATGEARKKAENKPRFTPCCES
ncbi:hypothetical protein CAter282_0002 [Collimonas arenae]|uniref:Uncharacterized protein n=1 Tax=Collimonas arenae TaxID=279058 RepID=A0A127QCW3_9BURK|nr:hypothetical protein CAter10_0002 [Collimonas arenae]AMP07826.1 hypothetical protein CAter282_0002 [Collimonas arenae]